MNNYKLIFESNLHEIILKTIQCYKEVGFIKISESSSKENKNMHYSIKKDNYDY